MASSARVRSSGISSCCGRIIAQANLSCVTRGREWNRSNDERGRTGVSRTAPARRAGGLRSMPGGIWALGLVSLLMDVSSEMIHALLPVFLVGTLGASYTFVGVMEGVAEAIASITKIFSGAASARLGRRKPLAVLGYGLAAVTKPMFALSAYPAGFLSDRLDRYGVLGCGAMLLVVGDIVLAFADTIA